MPIAGVVAAACLGGGLAWVALRWTVRGTGLRIGRSRALATALHFALLAAALALTATLLASPAAADPRDGSPSDPAWWLRVLLLIALIEGLLLSLALKGLWEGAQIHRVGRALRAAVPHARPELVERRRTRSRGPGLATPRARATTARLRLLAVGQLSETGYWEEAEALMADLDPAALPALERALIHASVAVCRLYAGDLDAARRRFALVERPCPLPAAEEVVVATGALLSVFEGNPQAALAAVGTTLEPDDLHTAVGRSRALVRAQAYAALDEHQRARRVLRTLVKVRGRAVLERVLLLGGPAAPHAAAVAAEGDAPYR
ncbi:MAG: hypothetical protein ACFCGT_13700 [Sandaracinaceae bacterium]